MSDSSVLTVLLHGEPVGTIRRLADDRNLLSFEAGYAADLDRPRLSLAFKSKSGDLITEHRPTRTRLHPFFSNLLPEGAMRDYLVKRAGVKAGRDFYLLAVLGKDLPGAVTIEAPELEAELGLREDNDGASHHGRPANSAERLRFSLAGVQLKFSAVQEAAGGLTIPAEGVGGSWIVKLPSAVYPRVPENEFSMMELARLTGIDVPEVRLVPVGQVEGLPEGMAGIAGDALAIRRFDRSDDGTRIHIEDFAQVFQVYPEEKYAKASYRNLAEVLWIEAGVEAVTELVKRLVFNALIGNADMHLKNWSLVYPDRRTPELAPGYDFVSTIAYLPKDTNMALSMAGEKGMHALTWKLLEKFVAKARLPRVLILSAAEEAVDRFHEAWTARSGDLPLSREHADRIEKHYQGIPLVKSGRPG